MEATRRILNILFWVVFIAGLIFLAILLIGGAFPIQLGIGNQKVKFDLSRIGWDLNDPTNGTFTITHEPKEKKAGWGALRYDYSYKDGGKYPGFYSTSYNTEGILNVSFWMKSEKPSRWQVVLKRKSDQKIFTKTFHVGKSWKKYTANIYVMRDEVRHKGKFSIIDFQKWIQFRDISSYGRGTKNTIWIDDILIMK